MGFDNIGRASSATLSTASRRSHEVPLSKCHQKCQLVRPEYFGHPAEFKGINKFIVLPEVLLLLNLPPIQIMLFNGRAQAAGSVSGVFENKNTAPLQRDLSTSQMSPIHWNLYPKHCHCTGTRF